MKTATSNVRGANPTLTVTYIPTTLYTQFSSYSRAAGRDMAYQMKKLITEFVEKGTEFKWGASKANFPGDKRQTLRHRNKRLYRTLIVKSIPPDLYATFTDTCALVDCSISVVCRRLISKHCRTIRNRDKQKG